MKITSLATYTGPPRWLFLRVETDDGTVGWGEPMVEGRAATVAAAVDELADHLVGRDLVDPTVFTYAGGMVTIPRGPGPGIEVDEEYVRERAREGHRWRNPIWRHADGSFAVW